MKKYSIQLVSSSAIIIILFIAVNFIVDPFDIYGTPKIKHFNLIKPSAGDSPRLSEIINVLRKRPEYLIIGTSREDSGIDPKHLVFNGHSVFNAAISSQPFLESKEILDSLSKRGEPPKIIVFGLLFELANVFGNPLPADYSQENFNPSRPYKLLLSLSTLKSSAKTIVKNLAGNSSAKENDGFRAPEEWVKQLLIGQHKAFKDNERHYSLDNHFPMPACKNALIGDTKNGTTLTPMEEVRDAVAIAYRMKSDMRLFVGPSHARQWETIQASGLWGQFEDWKRMVVEIVESEAVKAKARPFQVWDFSGYNTITTEPIPATGDKTTRMRYYYESSHYTPAAGDLVLDRIFNYHAPDRTVPDDFGVLLTSQNLESHLAGIRADREHYRQTHPDDIAEIEAMAREVAKTKRCQTQAN